MQRPIKIGGIIFAPDFLHSPNALPRGKSTFIFDKENRARQQAEIFNKLIKLSAC
jgi:hypothetical protein